MAYILRGLFGVGQSNQKSSPSSRQSKTHHRSQSDPTSYIFVSPPSIPPFAGGAMKHNNSYESSKTTRPSPLRYSTDAPVTMPPRSYSQQQQHLPPQTTFHRSSSYKYDPYIQYPVYTPPPARASSESRTTSTTSIQAASSHGHGRPIPSRASSSTSVNPPPRRPVLKHNHTWDAGFKPEAHHPQPHVSFLNPMCTISLHMHPLLASSRFHNAPISYDVMFAPCSHSVVDRNTRTAVPAHTLAQPATDPPIFRKLLMTCDKFPWPVVVSPSSKVGKFYIGSAPTMSSEAQPISNLDLLQTLYRTLSIRVTHGEWDALGNGSPAQRSVTRAYERRCLRMGGGWEGGVRRIDWLGHKVQLIGIEVDRSASAGGVPKLIFGRP
ncbi:uncharacterized protein BT62DRAFT_922986 [Guyanagaster necrorhizus]|uniref:DUF6699 domain-containing protein n=1 Tax=Guyanagaster necrorhizus TaxID=856835 RepID=A0A9P7VJQ5_9AGAR|nr:uncharacterized protein BT62DRAFT_922986 [Guyanagaster necrorhizus MCA 3950]KAG7441969.1 hypothetical protein BT62DRAFT_922986 [Guyanagaster necrorhizus MCA 3950]